MCRNVLYVLRSKSKFATACTVERWSSPNVTWSISTTWVCSSSGSFQRRWWGYIVARLFMLVTVSDALGRVPSSLSAWHAQAALQSPWYRNVATWFPMLVTVSGCSSPSALFVVSMIYTSSSSFSFQHTWFNILVHSRRRFLRGVPSQFTEAHLPWTNRPFTESVPHLRELTSSFTESMKNYK